MVFDPCPHLVTQVVIRAGAIIRELRGLPEEKNITILYNETAPMLGVAPTRMTSREVSKLPAPNETVSPKTNRPIMPKKDCLKCGGEKCVILDPLCRSCTDSNHGEFNTIWTCELCGDKIKSNKFYVQWLNEEVPNWGSAMKQSAGIKTVTDSGLK
jgi:hypothetical protein